jgi:uroporphyrinogen decarboxylase
VDRPACWLGMPTPSEVPHLCEYFGVKTLDELKASCGDDFYAIEVPYHAPTCSALYAAFDWYLSGTNVDTEHRTLTADGFFARIETVEEAESSNFPWPDPALYIEPAECRRLVDEAPKGKTILGMVWACHFQDFCAAFGMENAMMNMLAAPELVHYIDDRIVDFYLKALKIFLNATKGKVHAILIGDDLGSQLDLMVSPEMVKEFVIPGAKKLIDLAHSYGVKVVYHSCGSIIRAIPMLIEAGADAIHPIQALAHGMEPENLKEKFGDAVSFCGGVDTQELLPSGTPEQVMEKVKYLRKLFPTGLIISPSHEAIQSDVPPANIKAMFDEAQKVY